MVPYPLFFFTSNWSIYISLKSRERRSWIFFCASNFANWYLSSPIVFMKNKARKGGSGRRHDPKIRNQPMFCATRHEMKRWLGKHPIRSWPILTAVVRVTILLSKNPAINMLLVKNVTSRVWKTSVINPREIFCNVYAYLKKKVWVYFINWTKKKFCFDKLVEIIEEPSMIFRIDLVFPVQNFFLVFNIIFQILPYFFQCKVN